jgi:mevalonate kinase
MITASAPAKIILFGEHAVVYGQPAIAMPVSDLRATATVRPNPEPTLRIIATDLDISLTEFCESDHKDNALVLTARLALEALALPIPHLSITIDSQVPVAGGMGSGATVSTVLARALSLALEKPFDNNTLNSLVYEVEKLHHGIPSGIDNTVIVYEQPVYFVRNEPIQKFTISQPFTIIIANSGQKSLTRDAVGDVRRLYEANPEQIQPILDSIGQITIQARREIKQGNNKSLGKLMCENHTLLQQLTVSSPKLDVLVNAALDAGAIGAKLSGAGRGGNIIALVTPQSSRHVCDALLRAGAQAVYITGANQGKS